MTDRQGSRGGTTVTAEEGLALLERWRGEEMGWVRARIVQTARLRGEYHADDLADVPLAQPNVIGAAVRALLSSGVIESTGERRRNAGPAAHGRRSDVYRLTWKGDVVGAALHSLVGDRMPAPHPAGERERTTTPAGAPGPAPRLGPLADPPAPEPDPAPAEPAEQVSLFDLPDTPAAPLERTSPYAN